MFKLEFKSIKLETTRTYYYYKYVWYSECRL